LYLSGSNSEIALTDAYISKIQTAGGSYKFSCSGNCSIGVFNATSGSSNTWTSPDGKGEWYFLEEFYSTYYDYVSSVTLVFAVASTAESDTYWYLQENSRIYTQGYFIHGGDSAYFTDETSVWINQGTLETTSYWSVAGDSSTTTTGSFYNVGILKLVGGATFSVNVGNCGGKVILSDTDTVFSTYITTSERIANTGDIELEVADDFKTDDISYQYIWYYSSSKASSPDEFDSDGVPKTFGSHSDFDVESTDTTNDVKDIKTCYADSYLSVYYTDFWKPSKCSSPSGEKGICADEFNGGLPPATVDIPKNPASASGIVFSMVSLLWAIAALFILS